MHDLAISALGYDAMLVTELIDRVKPRLPKAPVWRAVGAAPAESGASSLAFGQSRVALVLHQRLWGHDAAMEQDIAALRARIRRRASSVLVVTLDAAPLPRWLAAAPHRALADVGIDGLVELVFASVTSAGGTLRRQQPRPAPAGEGDGLQLGESQAFLASPRAISALQRELDQIAAELGRHVRGGSSTPGGPAMVLQRSPGRIVVQVGGSAVTFSWVAGRAGTIQGGRLMVIEWDGVVSHGPGDGNSRKATPKLERVFLAEASSPADWRWRADDPAAQAYSSSHLAGQWVAGPLIAATTPVTTPVA